MTPNYAHRLRSNELAIFLLHGVIRRSSFRVRNYTRKHIEEDYFFEQMRDLKQAGTPVSLDEVLDHHRRGAALPPKAFAITFDDGFENNVSVAVPVLESLGIPATFYVSTAFIEENAMSWIDRIEACFEGTSKGAVCLPWDPSPVSFSSTVEQIAILSRIRTRVKSDHAIDPDVLADDICVQFGTPHLRSSDGPLDLKASWDQLSRLHAHKLFKVGGHAHRHEILSHLTDERLKSVVVTSLGWLRQKSGIRTVHYSYPEGLAHCYSEKVITVLKEHGIGICPTAIDGTNPAGTDPFHLKRIFMT